MLKRIVVVFAMCLLGTCELQAQEPPRDPELEYPEYACQADDLVVSRSDYHEKLQGFWLGQCIANWTGLRTEGVKKTAPFFTDKDWGTNQGRNNQKIEFVLVEEGGVWGADDDTDIEYIYQELLLDNATSILTPEQIRDGWLRHIKTDDMKNNFLWVSNQRALDLMMEGMLPPETSLPKNNRMYDQIDAQLTTEIFGLFAPGRPDVALKMAHLPIRVAAYREAEWISEFYVIMHSLASTVDPSLSMKEQTRWLAEQARKRLPDRSFPARMYDWIKAEYENNPDKDNWEKTRDRFARRYQEQSADGYNYHNYFDAGINYGASLISLFYGEGDLKRTIQIATLCGWDSDNPAATWGGLLGFMLGREGVEKQFPDKNLSSLFNISRTRINFPDRTPGQPGDDSFELMAERGIQVVDRVVIEEMGGSVDLDKGFWRIPGTGGKIVPAKY
jgi:hypothetical protein